jgi:ribose 5-phosphate isomerase RpiB
MKNRAKEFIKNELKKRNLTYIELSSIMNDRGYVYSENTIRSKINRGSYSFVFLLEVCDSLGVEFVIL